MLHGGAILEICWVKVYYQNLFHMFLLLSFNMATGKL